MLGKLEGNTKGNFLKIKIYFEKVLHVLCFDLTDLMDDLELGDVDDLEGMI